jgi:hypothetical protein
MPKLETHVHSGRAIGGGVRTAGVSSEATGNSYFFM